MQTASIILYLPLESLYLTSRPSMENNEETHPILVRHIFANYSMLLKSNNEKLLSMNANSYDTLSL